jgi:accessory colonization factor AcfC
MNIKRIGIDLAKQVFQVHGVDGQDNKGQTTVYQDIGGSLANSKTVAINCLLK